MGIVANIKHISCIFQNMSKMCAAHFANNENMRTCVTKITKILEMCNTRLRIFSNCANNCVQLRRSGKKRGPGRILNIFHTYVKLCPRCAPRILHMISSSCRQSHLTPHVDLPKICAKRAAHIFAYFNGPHIFSHIFANIRKYSRISANIYNY